jgi:hypothetical protein
MWVWAVWKCNAEKLVRGVIAMRSEFAVGCGAIPGLKFETWGTREKWNVEEFWERAGQ